MLRPNPNIARLMPAIHGGINYAEIRKAGVSPENVLDFSVSTNPFGAPPGIKEAVCQVPIDRYPDSESTELTQTLARKLNIPPDNLIIGSGSTELIRLAVTTYLEAGDVVIVPPHTYGDYEIACQLVDANVKQPLVSAESGFRLNVAAIAELIRKQLPRVLFLCNPNNPTGQYLSRAEIKEILSVAEDRLVILDEAYIAFTENTWSSLDLIREGNLIILRSMTKDYALAGLRLGYAVAAEAVITVLKRVRPPWNVSSVAQAAGIAALNAEGYVEACAVKLRESKEFLVQELQRIGCSPLPSAANFFVVKVKNASGLRQTLLQKGILVRDCSSFGLPNYIRLAPRTMTECETLIAAINLPEVRRYVS